jgi:predicted methyltransferase
MKHVAFALGAVLALAGPVRSTTPDNLPAYVVKAVAAGDRRDQAETDKRRHPAEILALAGVKPGDTVAELIPGSGYYTRLFSKIVGPTGHVFAIWPAEYDKVSHPDSDNLIALSKTKAYANITVLIEPAKDFSTPVPVNLVFTSLNYHDYPDKFMGPTDPAILDQQVFKALRAGGSFFIIDHMAQEGSGLRDTETLHRIDPWIVKRQVMAAGFMYAGSTAVLRNVTDDHTKPVFDPSVRGHTDQFVLKFRKSY